jgi:hypothetical protein
VNARQFEKPAAVRCVVKRFVAATYDAARYTSARHAETAAMMADMTKIPALIQPAIDAAAKYGSIAHALPAKELHFSG